MSFAAIWAPSVRSLLPEELVPFSNRLVAEIDRCRTSTKGMTSDHASREEAAADWLVSGLYEGVCSIPAVPLALPRSRNAYSSSSSQYVGYPYGAVTRLLEAAQLLGYVVVEQGVLLPDRKSIVTRVHAHGALLEQMQELGCMWGQLQPPLRNEQIQIGWGGKGSKLRYLNKTELERPDVVRWLDDLTLVNEVLGAACCFLDLPDSELTKLGQASTLRTEKSSSIPSGINYARRHLTRIFSRDKFDHGGRLYRGWWQEIPSKFRPYVTIGDHLTVEIDFSGIALRCMYALRGLDMPSDPYDIGLNYDDKSDPKRKLVKKFLNATINDETGRYRLSKSELVTLGLTHKALSQLIQKRHQPIADLFATGEGLRMQFYDSEIAMGVMTRFARLGEVCLPVHDSFIVRARLKQTLQEVMQEEFRRVVGVDCPVTGDDYAVEHRMYNIPPPPGLGLGTGLTVDYLNQHFERYSVSQAMVSSWYEYKRSMGTGQLDRDYSLRELGEAVHGR